MCADGIVHTISNNGAIWPSARDLNCSLKWGNERNPCPELYMSQETALFWGRKVRMTSNPHGPLMPWATLMLQWPVQWVAKAQAGANPIKAGPSSD